MRSKADTHVHTYFSGTTRYKALKFPESVTTPKEQVDRAIRNGYSVICITDHNTIKGGVNAKKYGSSLDSIDVVVGEEIDSREGEIIGLWLNEEIPRGLSIEETLDLIRSQGGVAIAPHPFSFYVHCLGERIFDLDIDGIEVLNGGHPDGYTNSRAQMVCEDNPGRWAEISASDAHSTYTAGYAWTEFEGSGEDDLRKAILSRSTVPVGRPAPVFTQVQWSIEVVSKARKMIGKSLVN
ncbi:MAG: PHP-associated domain-containing protein, partial [Candidatus Methanomethylophilaceae archaeon]|nr:PHP-associated domain-containing protein [Candidatus Methanomethylophilaceae archaeon]